MTKPVMSSRAFLPCGKTAITKAKGSDVGCFNKIERVPGDIPDPNKPRGPGPRNLYCNPPPVGGYGRAGFTIGKMPEFIADPYLNRCVRVCVCVCVGVECIQNHGPIPPSRPKLRHARRHRIHHHLTCVSGCARGCGRVWVGAAASSKSWTRRKRASVCQSRGAPRACPRDASQPTRTETRRAPHTSARPRRGRRASSPSEEAVPLLRCVRLQ